MDANPQWGLGGLEVHWIRQRGMKRSGDGNRKDSRMNQTELSYVHM